MCLETDSATFMQKLNIKCENTGKVLSAPKWGHTRSVCNHGNQIMDAEAYVASLGKSTCKAELGRHFTKKRARDA